MLRQDEVSSSSYPVRAANGGSVLKLPTPRHRGSSWSVYEMECWPEIAEKKFSHTIEFSTSLDPGIGPGSPYSALPAVEEFFLNVQLLNVARPASTVPLFRKTAAPKFVAWLSK